MQALIVVDAQNEFSAAGERTVPNHPEALARIRHRVAEARDEERPIAWIRHLNHVDEAPAFQRGAWGAELSEGLGPASRRNEILFEKDVFGAFTGTGLEPWLRSLGIRDVLLVGFFTHMCLSTTAREALVRGFQVSVDPVGTGARAITRPVLGTQSAEQVRATALLHLADMGVHISSGVAMPADSYALTGPACCTA